MRRASTRTWPDMTDRTWGRASTASTTSPRTGAADLFGLPLMTREGPPALVPFVAPPQNAPMQGVIEGARRRHSRPRPSPPRPCGQLLALLRRYAPHQLAPPSGLRRSNRRSGQLRPIAQSPLMEIRRVRFVKNPSIRTRYRRQEATIPRWRAFDECRPPVTPPSVLHGNRERCRGRCFGVCRCGSAEGSVSHWLRVRA
jgi:hypothetical protein